VEAVKVRGVCMFFSSLNAVDMNDYVILINCVSCIVVSRRIFIAIKLISPGFSLYNIGLTASLYMHITMFYVYCVSRGVLPRNIVFDHMLHIDNLLSSWG
jgi:hypothetical protein